MTWMNFMPGPVQVRPEILAEMSRPPVSHRGREMQSLLGEILPRLKDLFGLSRDSGHRVVLMTSSSTAMMEAAVVSTVPRGGKVLNLVCGGFSERWHQITQALGRSGVALRVEWGMAIKPQRVRETLQRDLYDAVTLVHNETSTGVMNPLGEIASVVREQGNVLLLVDTVSSLGGAPVEVEKHGIDVCLAGTQKCLALPPGLAVGAIAPRALERAGRNADRGYYLDLLTYVDFVEKGQAPFTASSAHLFALRRQLEDMERETFEGRYARHREMAEYFRRWAESRFALFAEDGYRSPTVTVVEVPRGFDLEGLYAALEEEKVRIAPGYAKIRDFTFRVGHMGDWRLSDVQRLTDIIDRKLESLR